MNVPWENKTGISYFPWILAVLHLGMAIVFTAYLEKNGGDAIRYWELTADTYAGAETWMQHWGTRTLFVQWLNYPFSKVLGLPFWFGNLLYASLSLWALMRLYHLAVSITWLKGGNEAWILALQLVFLLPNIHFWTAGVGKESLAFVGLVCVLLAWTQRTNAWVYMLVGIGLSWMVRPFQGLLLMGLFPFWLYKATLPNTLKWVLVVLLGLALVPAFSFIHLISHVESLSWAGITDFFQGQQEFLEGFEAGSYVSMESYAWWEVLGTFFFRPFSWEAEGFWQLASGLENLVALATVPIFFLLFWHPRFPKNFWPIWFAALLMMIVYAFSLNNFGIMMRMKSIFMLFFYIGAVWGIQVMVVTSPQKLKT